MGEMLFISTRDTQNLHWKRSKKGFQELELTDGQPKVLFVLREYEGCVQKDLAGMCDVKPSSMTLLLDGLEQKGLIERVKTIIPSGKRAFRIFLTQKGKAVADKVYELMETIEEECFEGISEEERQQLFDLLRRVRENLHRSCEEKK
ncbi:MAG: MarR family transcriptional regulator [Lachnospiraceae bacterium]|nr:MarR family transcriptional regulator [Lachnospiraceae bacterium]